MAFNAGAQSQSWSFTAWTANDQANLEADAANWTHESTTSNNRFKNVNTFTNQPLTANGVELETTAGLNFTATVADGIRCDVKGARLALNKSKSAIIIPNLTAGSVVTVKCKTSSKTEARGLNVTNLTPVSGSFNATSLDDQVNVGTVTADGSVTLETTGGMYVYSVTVAAEGEGPIGPIGGGVSLDASKNQMSIVLKGGDVKYFNTDDVEKVIFDGNKVTINEYNTDADPVIYDNLIESISFRKAQGGNGPVIENPAGKVNIKEAQGWFESVYVKWLPYSNATDYKVYVKGESLSDWTAIDAQLLRNYGSYGRADALGLSAGTYSVKVVPVIDGSEDATAANEVAGLEVRAHDRSGFAHKGMSGVGAYNDNGTLKAGTTILYVTKDNFNTVTMTLPNNTKGGTAEFVGLGEIFKALQKGYYDKPINVRFIGQITDSDASASQRMSDQTGLLLKANDNTTNLQVTIEGVGEDASLKGFGLGFVNGCGVEVRNIATMLHGSSNDNIEIKGTCHIWVHNCDFFYGSKGGGDHDKGDGSLDSKDECSFATFSYNHFYDCGKCNLSGMKSEVKSDVKTYHHNWYDHCDSRCPRIRATTHHIYNNYYDGVSKYGVGATTGCSAFVENNYFRGTSRPMMSSKQGTDANGNGTFSGEDGGIIKSFGNMFVEKPSNFSYITYKQNSTSFDAYEASSRDEVVPASVKTLSGGTSYSNFDTDAATMYAYTPDAAADVPVIVTGWYGAGRINHGDIHYTFNNSVDDSDYGRNAGLDALLSSYKCSLTGFFGSTSGGSTSGGTTGGGDDPIVDPDPDPVPTPDGAVLCSFEGKAPSSNLVTVSGNYSTSKGSATYGGNTYSTCVKLESSTSIAVNVGTANYNMTLVFGDSETASAKIDGTKISGSGSTYTTAITGTVTITKDKSVNLYLIVLEPIQ